MSGLGIDFGHESEAYSTDNGSHTSAASTSTSGFHSRTRAHMIPKKSSMNKMRGARPKTAEEDSRRVRIVSGEPSVLGHGAYTDEDFLSPSALAEEIVVQPHQLHSLSAAVAAMGGYSTDTATSSTETDSDQSPTLTESSITSSSSGASGGQKVATLKKHASQPQLNEALGRHPHLASKTMSEAHVARPASNRLQEAGDRTVQKSKSNTSLASGYRSDGGSSLGRSAEISRGVGRQRVSIRGAANRQEALKMRIGPKIEAKAAEVGHKNATKTGGSQDAACDAETEVMFPDGFGGHIRTKQPRSKQVDNGAAQVPVLLQRLDMKSEHAPSETQTSQPPAKWRVGSFYGPDGSETGRYDYETGTISEHNSQVSSSDVRPAFSGRHSVSDSSTVTLSRSQTSSQGPKASMMQSPANQVELQSGDTGTEDNGPKGSVEGSTKAAALLQNRRSCTSLASVSMRSKRGLQGLEEAERGGALVSLDKYRMTYDTGLHILPHEITALDQDSIMGSVRLGNDQPMKPSVSQDGTQPSSSMQTRLTASPTKQKPSEAGTDKGASKVRNRPRRSLSESTVIPTLLERHGTLLSTTANPLRRSKELNRLLGNSDRKLPASAARPVAIEPQTKNGLKRSNAVAASVAPPPAALEQGKASKARVEVDLVLESDLVVEGSTVQGRMQIRVRKGSDKEGGVFLGQPKIRVVGFEELLPDDTRYIFYHHASVIDGDRSNNGPSGPYFLHGSPALSSPETAPFSALACFSGQPDAEGYAEGKVGSHSIPFSLELPVSKGAKGSYRGKNAVVRYIVIGSVKLKSASGANRSIAHFYRHIDLFPYLNPAVVLSNAPKPIQATSSKGLFLGGSGKVHLMASLHRNTWVAGQRIYIHVDIQNDTSKKVNGMTLSLIRTVTLYKPRPELDLNGQTSRRDLDPDACQTSTTRKKIAEEELEMGQKGSRGVVTARGWWTGVEPGQRVESSHYMQIPADALSISRGRHVEVAYSIKVSIGSSLSSDVSVEVPLRVINFVSLDPPPLKKAGGAKDATRSWSAAPGSVFSVPKSPTNAIGRAANGDADQMVARLKSVDAMRSPGKTEISLQNYEQHLQAARILSPGEVKAEQTRRLQHQKSLDFINHAIRSAAARRGVDVTPTTSSSSRTSGPAGLGIGVPDGDSASSDSNTGSSPGGSSSTDGVSGADEDYIEDAEREDDNAKTPMASTSRSTSSSTVYPPGCEPYEPHHHQAHQAKHNESYSHLPVTLNLPGSMHHMQQMQMQMYHQMSQMHSTDNPTYVQGANPAMGGAILPMLRINNANAVSLDEIGDDYDDDDQEGHADPDQTLALNDESMAEMNLVIGSARLGDDDEAGQFDDSVQVDDVHERDHEQEKMQVLGEEQQQQHRGREEEQGEGWSLRRRGSAEDEEGVWLGEEEADDAAEISSIMQAVSIAPPITASAEAPASERSGPPSSTIPSSEASTVHPAVRKSSKPLSPLAPPYIPKRGDSRTTTDPTPESYSITKPLKICKEASSSLLPQQVIRAKPSAEQLVEHATKQPLCPPAFAQHTLSSANLKRHSDNLTHRYQHQQQQQQAHQSRHKATHSVTGLKPLILKPRPASEGRKASSTAGSRTPDTATPSPVTGMVSEEREEEDSRTPEGVSSVVHAVEQPIAKVAAVPTHATGPLMLTKKPSEASLSTNTTPLKSPLSLPRSSTLQSVAAHTHSLRHSDSTSSLLSDTSSTSTSTPAGALSRSHSTHNLRGAAVMVPSVRNKIAMLESRSAALREFTGTSGSSSPINGSPMRSSASMGKVAQLLASAEKANSGSCAGQPKLDRKGSVASMAESEDGASSAVSSVVTVPDYVKTAGSGVSGFHAPVLRSLR